MDRVKLNLMYMVVQVFLNPNHLAELIQKYNKSFMQKC